MRSNSMGRKCLSGRSTALSSRNAVFSSSHTQAPPPKYEDKVKHQLPGTDVTRTQRFGNIWGLWLVYFLSKSLGTFAAQNSS